MKTILIALKRTSTVILAAVAHTLLTATVSLLIITGENIAIFQARSNLKPHSALEAEFRPKFPSSIGNDVFGPLLPI